MKKILRKTALVFIAAICVSLCGCSKNSSENSNDVLANLTGELSDVSGIQVYDKAALLPTAKYSDNYLIDEAMEIFRQNLTMEEIYALAEGATPALLARTGPLLSEAQLAAIYEASFEEYKEAVENLIRVAEKEGAGGDNLDAAANPGTPADTASDD